MSTVDRPLVEKLATLSRLSFTSDEIAVLQGELGRILDFISQLQEVKTDGVAPMTSVVEGTSTRERPDLATETDRREDYMAIAPQSEMGFYVVPRVVE
jgi:aspartyl-tRNA(Asn)/glutamyl-tRNA(Gln) amidotransferase subunit C